MERVMSKQYILEQKINKFFEENSDLSFKDKGKDFLVFVLHVISPYELETADTDDLMAGIVEGGGDLGIDAVFAILNGKIIRELSDLENEGDEEDKITSDSKLKVLFFQTKKRRGFDEKGFRKSMDSVKRILNLDTPLENLKELGAEEDLLEKIQLIRNIYEKLANLGIHDDNVDFRFFYVTKGNAKEVTQPIETIKKETEKEVNKNIIGTFSVKLIGIDELISFTQKKPTNITLEFIQPPVEIETPVKSYIGVINAKKLMDALLDNERKNLDKTFFEDNVRHFLGLNKNINKTMKETALNEPEQFWYFNNGITMISDKVESISQKKYRITNPQVVNGLQTLYSLYETMKTEEGRENLNKIYLTLRLVSTNDTELKMKVISYTNSQNRIEEPSLKAIDKIHKLIEEYLRPNGIYYERRLNYYKSQGIKGVKVIDLRRMAQILWSIYQKEAIFAYNDPKKIFTDEDKYKKIFPSNTNINYDYYLFASKLYVKIWSLKRSDVATMEKNSKEREVFSSASALLLLLNTISSLIFRSVQNVDLVNHDLFKDKKKKEEIFKILESEQELNAFYFKAKKIIMDAIQHYKEDNPNKNYVKDRKFDVRYLLPIIKEYLSK